MSDYRLPYLNHYEVVIPNAGRVTVSLKRQRYNTKIGLDFANLPNVEWVTSGSSGSYMLSSGQILSFIIMNVPDNGNLWYPAVAQGTSSFDALSPSPSFDFSGGEVGTQNETWDFGDGGVLTIRYAYLAPQVANAWLAAVAAITNAGGVPKVISCNLGEGPYRGDFERGFCSIMYCSNSPESWVRGRADFDTASGLLTYTMQLETDSTTEGPKGQIHIDIKDANGQILATIDSDQAEIGGKRPGKALIKNFCGSKQLPPSVCQIATQLGIRAECQGKITRVFNISIDDIVGAIKDVKTVVTALGSAGSA